MNLKRKLTAFTAPTSTATLASFRVLLGLLMLGGTLRFMYLGWIETHYLATQLHFSYYGFGWLTPLNNYVCSHGWLLYALHTLLALSSLAVVLNYRFRLAAWLQFVLFTYLQLLDVTYYLNHYYLLSLLCGILAVLPANSLSINSKKQLPRYWLILLHTQIALVYIFAGLAKINSEWLLEAMPLRIWLPAHNHLPLLGPLLALPLTPWLFAWAGMLYDISIVFLLALAPQPPTGLCGSTRLSLHYRAAVPDWYFSNSDVGFRAAAFPCSLSSAGAASPNFPPLEGCPKGGVVFSQPLGCFINQKTDRLFSFWGPPPFCLAPAAVAALAVPTGRFLGAGCITAFGRPARAVSAPPLFCSLIGPPPKEPLVPRAATVSGAVTTRSSP